MRLPAALASALGLAALTLLTAAPPHPPATAALTRQDTTPIVVPPEPTPRPIYAPYVNRNWDPLAPEPVDNIALGWLAALQPEGRTACVPATHVLLRFPEGALNNVVEAVVAPASPGLTLDLFVNDYVRLNGGVDLAPDPCRFLTWRMILATRVRSMEPPPP